MAERYLVTGATGFIGANLVRVLLDRGDRPRCLIRRPNRAIEGLDLELVEGPLVPRHAAYDADVDALARLMDGCEGIYHVAGTFDPGPGGSKRMREIHVYATRALCEAAERAGVRRIVVCSSSVTVGFGPREAPGNEETPLDPDAIYGRSGPLRDYHDTKRQAEQIALGWKGIEAVVVNPDFTIGPWDVKPTSGKLIVGLARRPIPFHPRGGKLFQHVRDCALGHVLAMERGASGRRYLLGTENLSYREFLHIVAEVVGRRPPRLPLPDLFTRLAGVVGRWASRADPHRFAGLDPFVLRAMQQDRYRTARRSWEELGVPRTPVAQAVEEAYRWFVDHGYC